MKNYTLHTYQYKNTVNQTLSLDLLTPNKAQSDAKPLIVWIHGGAWMRGSRQEFMEKNGLLGQALLNEGYAVASLDYRLTDKAIFPAQINDVNDAINFLMMNAQALHIQPGKVVVMGRSAGGHLASLLATTNGHDMTPVFNGYQAPNYHITAAVVFFAPIDLVALKGNSGRVDHDAPDAAEARLLGDSPRNRPDLAKWASPTAYISELTPPFLIFHGSSDQTVPPSQGALLQQALNAKGVENQFYVAQGARHGDPVFDTELYVSKIITFVNQHLE